MCKNRVWKLPVCINPACDTRTLVSHYTDIHWFLLKHKLLDVFLVHVSLLDTNLRVTMRGKAENTRSIRSTNLVISTETDHRHHPVIVIPHSRWSKSRKWRKINGWLIATKIKRYPIFVGEIVLRRVKIVNASTKLVWTMWTEHHR